MDDTRINDLTQLHTYIEGIDKEVTMILQNLQWDRNRLIEGCPMVTCRYDKNHKLPPDRQESHEKWCFLKSEGYVKDDPLLPDPMDINANALVKLNTEDIMTIIKYAVNTDPTFKKGSSSQDSEPWTLERLQSTYTADERRAIHDAVVQAVPSCHDLADLALPCHDEEGQKTSKSKSRAEILAELRDMKRRRAKYRVATKSKNYSDVLRDVIKTQMELYAEVQQTAERPTSYNPVKSEGVEIPKKEIKEGSLYDDYNATPSSAKNRNREHSREGKERKHGIYKEHNGRDRYRRDSPPSIPAIKSHKREINEHHSYRQEKYRSNSRDRKRGISERDDRSSRKYKHKSDRHYHEEYTKHYVRHTDESNYEERRKRKKHS